MEQITVFLIVFVFFILFSILSFGFFLYQLTVTNMSKRNFSLTCMNCDPICPTCRTKLIQSENELMEMYDEIGKRVSVLLEENTSAILKNLSENDMSLNPVLLAKMTDVLEKLRLLEERTDTMKLNLDSLAAEVARVHTVQSSAKEMLMKLAGELESVSAELARKAAEEQTIDTAPLDALIAELKTSTDALAGAVADSSNVIPTKEVILHADDPTVPTVQVNLPEVMPEHVAATAEVVVDAVDTTSVEPQVVITVEEAPAEAPVEPVVEAVIATDEGEVDVNVVAPAAEVEAVKADAAVDVVAEIQEAYDVTPEVVAEPMVEAPAEMPAEVPADAPVEENKTE